MRKAVPVDESTPNTSDSAPRKVGIQAPPEYFPRHIGLRHLSRDLSLVLVMTLSPPMGLQSAGREWLAMNSDEGGVHPAEEWDPH